MSTSSATQSCFQALKYGAILVSVIVIFFALIIGVLTYQLEYAVRTVDQQTHGTYTVKLSEIGEPLFFGPSTMKVELTQSGKVIAHEQFDLANDGKYIEPDIWSVSWSSTGVETTYFAEEQSDFSITLTFEGETYYTYPTTLKPESSRDRSSR